MRMKVIFSIKALNNSGGTERVTAVVASALAERGHDVGIVSFVGGGESPFFPIDERVKVWYLAGKKDPYPFPVRDCRRIYLLRKLYREEQPDVVVVVDAGRSFVNVPAAKGRKLITWEHFNVRTNWLVLHQLSRRLAARYSDAIVTLTRGDAEGYKELFGANRVRAIANPVTIDTTLRSPLSEHVVLGLGRYCPQKGFDLLIEAWARIAEKGDWQLHIVGSGEDEQMLKERIAKHHIANSVQLLPKTKQVEHTYRSASVFALSSRYEGLPLVMIEALSCGLPIVAFDCPTGPRDIIEDGKSGLLIPAEDVDALAKALERVMGDEQLRLQLSQAAAKEAREKFDIQPIVKQWEELFAAL